MKELVFATGNRNKLKEVQKILGDRYILSTPADKGMEEDIPETSDTLEGNALQKARYIYEKTGADCFADDTGLEIDALGGEPGVYSARYAGEKKDPEDNMDKVLKKMKGTEDRSARFRTVIALIIGGKEYLFEGVVNGTIMTERSGSEGFGYDPIFRPDGFAETFAEMDLAEKNRISHRGLAVARLAEFLKKYEE